ncbi:unnamed protein product [Ostreobium quekettii]|uniref:Serine incorporator n=1 Tax=Ostreobium quekettii TaxID=121088 RepID=A0A8S1J180_9CHLO|nr:unnamed protein product [Ostreobium quekettii]
MLATAGTFLGTAASYCCCMACRCAQKNIFARSARAGYCVLFTLAMVLAWVMRNYAKPLIEKIPWVMSHAAADDSKWFGQQGAYRISLGSFIFFALLSLIMTNIKYKSDWRNKYLQHGGWGIKFALWLLFLIIPFFIPGGLEWYGWVARFGSGLFLIVQMMILLDATGLLNDLWFSKSEENPKYMYLLLGVTAGCYIGTVAMAAVGFWIFKPSGGGSCTLNILLIVWSLLLTVGFSLMSVHPGATNGSLFPASVMSAYCMYLCLAALESEPRGECNGLENKAESASAMFFAMMLTLGAVIYSAFRAGSNTSTFFTTSEDGDEPTEKPLLEGAEAGTSAGLDGEDAKAPEIQKASRDDKEGRAMDEFTPVTYSYSFFHAVFALASMYMAMLMTSWGTGDGSALIDVSWASVWVKMGSQVVTALLYCWTLVAPIVFPDRDFS